MTDGNGQKTTYTYDALDRVVQVLFGGATTCVPSSGNCISYGYDNDGNMTSMVDNTGITSYYYDPMNRLTTESLPDTTSNCSGSSPAGMTFSYDGVGSLLQYCDSRGTVAYAYDAADRLISIAEPGGSCGPTPSLCTTFSYDANDNRTLTTFPGGATLNMAYDNDQHVVSVVGKDKNGGILTSFSYTYTAGTSDRELLQAATQNDAVANSTYTYGYDALNRLTQATVTAGTGTNYSYNYDGNSNMLSRTAGASVTSFAFNTANEICWAYAGASANPCSSAPAGATTYAFDADGNETSSSAGASFSYNPKNQSTAITFGGLTLSPLAYSGAGQVRRTAAGQTNFASGPQGVALSTTTGSSIYYLRDHKGNLLGEQIGGAHYYYLTDVRGSVVAVIAGDGLAVGDRYGYDPYGRTTYQSGTVTNPWGYAGGLVDPTGLIKFGARYYDPGSTGRFTQADVACGDDNPYAYAGGDPVNKADPSGESWVWTTSCNTYYFWPFGAIRLCTPTLKWQAAAKWTCTVSCQLVCWGVAAGYIGGRGTGGSSNAACNNAKSDANGRVPPGCYKRHCQCKCTKK